jgi:hypothetical protein
VSKASVAQFERTPVKCDWRMAWPRRTHPLMTRISCRGPGKDVLAFPGIDSTQKRVCGHKKQGAAFGHIKIGGKSLLVRGLNALAAVISTPAAPVIAAARLRGGNAASARGAVGFAAEAIATAREAGCTGLIAVRMDSAYLRREGDRGDPPGGRAVPRHGTDGPQGQGRDRGHPRGRLDARQVSPRDLGRPAASLDLLRPSRRGPYTAFTSKNGQAVTARLIVRRGDLIHVAARIARSHRGHLTLHLPDGRHR